jgi:sulfite reductase (NADPH) hemoprotein beta-component
MEILSGNELASGSSVHRHAKGRDELEKIPGCINAGGYYHVGDIGILGVEKRLVDTYIARRESPDEPVIAAFRRLGEAPFKEALHESR